MLLDGQSERARGGGGLAPGGLRQGALLPGGARDQQLEGQKELNRQLVGSGQALDVRVVATNDSHYIKPEDSSAHDVLLCIQTGATVEQTNRMRLGSAEFFLRSGEEMARAFPGLDEALRNTLVVAEQVDVKLEFDRVLLPHFELPDGHDPDSYLAQ